MEASNASRKLSLNLNMRQHGRNKKIEIPRNVGNLDKTSGFTVGSTRFENPQKLESTSMFRS